MDRDNLENSSVEAVINVGSINTFNENAATPTSSRPIISTPTNSGPSTFKSTSWKKTGDNQFDVAGNLTIKGITKEVVLKVTLLGFGPGMRGAQLSGWEAHDHCSCRVGISA